VIYNYDYIHVYHYYDYIHVYQKLSTDCHVIAVDLPGHGDSDTPGEEDDISHTHTVNKMHQVGAVWRDFIELCLLFKLFHNRY